MTPHILSVAYDKVLLDTRRMILEGGGHRVTSALGYMAALAECDSGGFDLFILGHSIPIADKQTLIKHFREHCKAPIVSLRRAGEPVVDVADHHCYGDEPEELLSLVDDNLRAPGR